MNLLLAAWFLVTFYKADFKLNDFHDCLSQDSSHGIRAIAALVVVLHHVAQQINSSSLFSKFVLNYGILTVVFFFFYSGYGLLTSFKNKPDYLKGYIPKRILSVLLPYLLATLIYWLGSYILGQPYTARDVLTRFSVGWPIVSFSWFVVVILIFYCEFYVLAKLLKTKYSLYFPVSLVFLLALIFILVKIGFPIFWYHTAVSFSLGLLVAQYADKIVAFLKKFYYPLIIADILLLTVVMHYIINGYTQYFETMLLYTAMCVLGVLFLMLELLKIKIKNPVLSYISKISFGVYLIHGLVIEFFNSRYVTIEKGLLWSILIVAVSLLLGAGLDFIFKKMNGAVMKLVRH